MIPDELKAVLIYREQQKQKGMALKWNKSGKLIGYRIIYNNLLAAIISPIKRKIIQVLDMRAK